MRPVLPLKIVSSSSARRVASSKWTGPRKQTSRPVIAAETQTFYAESSASRGDGCLYFHHDASGKGIVGFYFVNKQELDS
jgi:hypothetical protein